VQRNACCNSSIPVNCQGQNTVCFSYFQAN
jgi:hypothetical protein